MRVVVKKNELKNAVQKLQGFVDHKSTLPILHNIYLLAEDGKLHLTATDLTVSCCKKISANVIENGSITIDAKHLLSIVKIADSDIEIFVGTDDIAHINFNGTSAIINGISRDFFPSISREFFPRENEFVYSISTNVLVNMLKKTQYAASEDDTRKMLQGVLCFIKDNKISIVATDGRCLVVAENDISNIANFDCSVIIPIKTVKMLINTLDSGDVQIKVIDNHISFTGNDIEILSSIQDGKFPAYEHCIPTNHVAKITVSTSWFLKALKYVKKATTKSNMDVGLIVGDNQLKLSASGLTTLEYIIRPIECTHPLQININPVYIIELLSNIKDENVDILLLDEKSPIVVTNQEKSFLFVLMPFRKKGF